MKKILLIMLCMSTVSVLSADEFRFTLPGQRIEIDTPPRNIILDVREEITPPSDPPVTIQPVAPPPQIIYIQPSNGNGPPPIPEELADIIELRLWFNSHFRAKRGILGLGILPCVSYVPRRVTDPAVWNYHMMYPILQQGFRPRANYYYQRRWR